MRPDMKNNQEVLARILALQAIRIAQSAHLPPAVEKAMTALRSAIDDKRACVLDLVQRGRVHSPEYFKAKAQIKEWEDAFGGNR